MKLFGEKKLAKFAKKHPQFRNLLAGFKLIVVEAAWKGQHEIPAAFNTAQKENMVLIRLGQSCRLVAQIEYATAAKIAKASERGESKRVVGTVIICQTWTHEEYNDHLNDWWK